VDVHVEPAHAGALRRRLLDAGFAGDPAAAPTAPQHLAPLTSQGGLVEIHTRLVAPFWGLPEAGALASATPLAGAPTLGVPGPEALLLHAAAHTAQDSFASGLKTAWDILWIAAARPALDWDRLAGWIRQSRMPRGMWAVLKVLARDLALPVPADFLRLAPADGRQARLELIARRRLFHAVEGPGDLDFVSRQALRLLMQDGWAGGLRYLTTQVATRGGQGALWRGTARRTARPGVLREALSHYRSYRRALRERAGVSGAE
jgi:hypothetical protein